MLAGGTESMSQAPHVVRGARWGLRLGPAPPLEDTLWEALRDAHCGLAMAETAENLAEQYGLDRAEVDAYARAEPGRAPGPRGTAGAFADEVVPVPLKNRKTKQAGAWAADEHMRPDTTRRGPGQAAALLQEGRRRHRRQRVGHLRRRAALVLAGEAVRARSAGFEPLGRLVAWGVAGVEPSIMGIGPAPAARAGARARGARARATMDLVEVNEAFAAQYLAVERELGLDRERTNVDGGAIALGHPLGASGARITAHLLHALRRRGGRYGLGTACIGGGQGVAVIVEAFPPEDAPWNCCCR